MSRPPTSGCFCCLRILVLLSLLGLALIPQRALAQSAAPVSPLAGTWRFDAERSTELSPWRSCELTITVHGETVTIARQLGAGRRGFSDTMTLDLSAPDNVVPVTMWPDNRHLGAYISDAHSKHVRGEWLDTGRILRLTTDLVLSTPQGERAVNILSDYKVSASGTLLTLTELRSTRNRPIVYVFNRIDPAVK